MEVSSPGNDSTHIRVTMVLIDDKVLSANKDATGPIAAAGDGDKEISPVINRFSPLPGDVIEAEVELVEGEMLLGIESGLAGGILVRFGVVKLDGREDRVVKATINAGNGVGDGVGLVSFERGRDGEAGNGVAIENVHELLFLASSDHNSAALGVDGEILARNDAAAARLPEGLLVDFIEAVAVLAVLEDDDAAGIGADDDVVFLGASKAELGEGADDAEDFDGVNGLDLAGIVRAEEIKGFASGDDDLLGLAADEVAVGGAHDARRLLQRQAI